MLDSAEKSAEQSRADDSKTSAREVVLVGHSSLFYWWPVWALSLFLGVHSLMFGREIAIDEFPGEKVIASNSAGLVFLGVLLLVILFTNVRMRGMASVAMLLTGALAVVSLAYFEVLDDIARAVPQLSVHMNAGFFLLFGTLLFLMWTAQFFFFDQLTYYRIRAGQLTEERLIGGGERSYDAGGMQFEQLDKDFFRHNLLGLGAGDLLLHVPGRKRPLEVSNVLWVERRVDEIQSRTNVRPESAR